MKGDWSYYFHFIWYPVSEIDISTVPNKIYTVGLIARGEGRKIRCSPRVGSTRWGVPSEFWKRPWPLSGPSQTSERDSMVFGFIIAYVGRPRRIIAHEDPTRRKIYGPTRCNSPTETGRHSQINFAKRRHESGSPPASNAQIHAFTCISILSVWNKSAIPRTWCYKNELSCYKTLSWTKFLYLLRSIFIAQMWWRISFQRAERKKGILCLNFMLFP